MIYIGLLPFITIFGFARGMPFLPLVITMGAVLAIAVEIVIAVFAADNALYLEDKDMISTLKGKK